MTDNRRYWDLAISIVDGTDRTDADWSHAEQVATAILARETV